MGLNEYLEALRRAVEIIRKFDEAVIVHHDDADGLLSAAVLMEALKRAGMGVVNIPLERVHPKIVERVFKRFGGLIVFTDLGAGAAGIMHRYLKPGDTVVIIDHHNPSRPQNPNIHNFSSENYGLSGEKEISSASAAYLFARVLDRRNRELAYLGVLGAVGDSHHRFGRLEGVNRLVLEEAASQGQVRVREEAGKEKYYLTRFGGEIDADRFAKSLTAAGAVGYLMDGPRIGIRAALMGPDEEFHVFLEKLNSMKARAFSRVLEKLRSRGLVKTRYFQWFHVHDDFSPMGVKVIGEFCMEIRNADFVDQSRYLAGFQNMPRIIPKLGEFDWRMVKVSFRLPRVVEKKVLEGEMPGYKYLVSRAAPMVGGDLDACHDYACATTFEEGLEERFIEYLDKYVDEYRLSRLAKR